MIEYCVRHVDNEMKKNKLSRQINQINVMANVLFFINQNAPRSVLVASIHKFIVDKRFMHEDPQEQVDHFRRTMHMSLYCRHPIDKFILWNTIFDISELDQYFNRNSRNNVLYKVRLKLRGKHKKYMGTKEDKQHAKE